MITRKKVFSTAFLGGLLALSVGGKALANDTWFDFHSEKTPGAGIGIAKRVTDNVWAAVRMDGLGKMDITSSVTALYVIPKRFIIFDLYGGGGLDYSHMTGELGPHMTMGSKFLWFFNEAEYRLVDRGTFFRQGIRITF